MNKKLYRSNSNKMIAGVCGGLGDYFNIDATIVRLIWTMFVLMGGTGLLAYIVCVIVIPKETRF
jgi:phage shock protein PspC (stress-responsive transcriptional regulator)